MLKLNTNAYNLKIETRDFTSKERVFFHDLNPDFKEILTTANDYSKYNNLVIIGNGGAVNSFLVLYHALYKGRKHVEILNSMEPDLINELKKRNCREDTLVIVASTSGTNVGVLEIMSQFMDYEKVVITAENEGALRKIAEKKAIKTLFVPHITDRFLTSGACAYFPLALLGIDIRKIDSALHEAYKAYSPDRKDNDAAVLSTILYELEQRGYSEVFLPIYSHSLEAFSIYIMQLMHESVSKKNKSQSFIVVSAPESQHHSNQRFFGGQRNISGLFLQAGQADQTSKVEFSEDIQDIALRDGVLSDINNTPLARSFEFEAEATHQDAINNHIPSGVITLDRIDEENVAQLIAFWHYMAVYSSWLRKVDPFDQPQVEKSKEIAFMMRKNN